MAEFKPKSKERGNVILAEDWNSAMSEIVRLNEQTLKRIGGTVQGDLNVAGTLTTEGNCGVGTASPAAKLHCAGARKIDGNNTLEFGAGVSGKEANAGKIGYQTFTTDTLDMIGAGTSNGNRKIKFWAEGDATIAGSLTVAGNSGVGTTSEPTAKLEVNGAVKAAGFEGDGSKLTGITAADARWNDTADRVQYKAGKKAHGRRQQLGHQPASHQQEPRCQR